jgi:hypothetical protein
MARTDQKVARAATRFSANYKARSRARIAKMVAAGRGGESFGEVASLLGVDLARGQRPRLVSVCGHKVG